MRPIKRGWIALSDLAARCRLKRTLAERILLGTNLIRHQVGCEYYLPVSDARKLKSLFIEHGKNIRTLRAPLIKPGSNMTPEIYFIRCEDYVKIGIGYTPSDRIGTLQVGCPFELVMIGTIPGTIAEELALHRRFASMRIRGEWFRYEGDLKAYIEATVGDGSKSHRKSHQITPEPF